jgi:hypothetical protein
MMRRKRIIDADKVIGRCDMSYDEELAKFEAAERHALTGGYSTFPLPTQCMSFTPITFPVDLERKADKYRKDVLSSIR